MMNCGRADIILLREKCIHTYIYIYDGCKFHVVAKVYIKHAFTVWSYLTL